MFPNTNAQLLYEKGDLIDKTRLKECKNRLNSLEPEKPISKDSEPIYNLPLPTNIKSVSEVLEKGKEIPLNEPYPICRTQ
jgi:hypothetical protein